MADRSPNIPRRSWTPEVAAAGDDDDDASNPPRPRQQPSSDDRQQHILYTPRSEPPSKPSEGDRSPSKPKRFDSPVLSSMNKAIVAVDVAPSRSQGIGTGGLSLSLREDLSPTALKHEFHQQLPYHDVTATSSAVASYPLSFPMLPPHPQPEQGLQFPQTASEPYAFDDESTQTWNESARTLSLSIDNLGSVPGMSTSAAVASSFAGEGEVTSALSQYCHHRQSMRSTTASSQRPPEDSGFRLTPMRNAGCDGEEGGGPAPASSPAHRGANQASEKESPESCSGGGNGQPSPATTASLSPSQLLAATGAAATAAVAAAAAQSSSSSSSSSSAFLRPMGVTMDLAPGVQRPLWPSEVTRRALVEGGQEAENVAERACANPQCSAVLLCVRSAGYVLCPDCCTVSPLVASPSSSDADDSLSSVSAICVGVKREETFSTF
jgi:hypothetical protein